MLAHDGCKAVQGLICLKFISSQLRHCGFADHDLITISNMLDTYQRDFRVDHPVLCHGDFITKHLFVDTTLRLTGIIDFGDVPGGPPIHDLAYLHMWRPEIDLGWLRSAYGRAACIDERFEQRLVLHTVCVQPYRSIDGRTAPGVIRKALGYGSWQV